MSDTEIRAGIKTALKSLEGDDLPKSARALFGLLGYESERISKLDGDPKKFTTKFPSKSGITGTKSEEVFLDSVESIDIIFQIMDEEIKESAPPNLLEGEEFDSTIYQSFLFLAVQLKPRNYARGVYAQMAREVNKRLGMPTVVLFMNDGKATISFMGRRPDKVRKDRYVLGKVFLIRDIDCAKPHRAHVDILADLSLDACLNRMEKEKNFEGLLAVWLKTLDTEELNKKFFEKLHEWYQWAVDDATFPSPKNNPVTPQDQVIRLITRILFVWFIKEKHLVSDELFNDVQVRELLKDYHDDGDNYYFAILQNLFFATLNTEIGKRGFSKEGKTTHRNFNLYRYKNMLADEKLFLKLMQKTPFINGGLFDCLDSEESTSAGGYRLDCFTDNTEHRKELSVPNHLFFDSKRGLFPLLDKYKFTVEENTPIEQEVALDPELLGKVFENLLAAYNPETSKSARRQTGSYYTPRVVVDYMVDEALLAYLGEKVAPDDGDAKLWGERLRYLLDYADAFDDAEELFSDGEKRAISSAVADIRVLDPAVGSGAFPMGVLHKLSLVLRRIDPNNKIWEGLQKARARERLGAAVDTDNPADREEELTEISRTFQTYRESDFGRKLHLIQNSIFGVDIQPIACQIAKLRFFISLAIEQKTTKNENDNYGVKPLPNLETRFVAANALLGLEKPQQMSIGETEDVRKLERQLGENRERHFNASSRQKKLDCIKEDRNLRQQLKEKLGETGLPPEQAEKIAQWNPYDQNARADWFDAEYMFGNRNGFDLVIGNPPYRQVPRGIHSRKQFPYSEGKDRGKQNLYKLFVEQSYNLAAEKGIGTMIVQSALMCDYSSSGTRELLLNKTQLNYVLEFPERARTRENQVFTSVAQGTCIYQFVKSDPVNNSINISVGNDTNTIENPHFAKITNKTIFSLYPDLFYIPHIRKGYTSILKKITQNKDISLLNDHIKSINQGDLNLTVHSDRFSNSQTSVLLLRGRHVSRYIIKYDESTEYCDYDFMEDKVEENQKNVFLISQQVMSSTAPRRLHFSLAENIPTDFLWGNSVNKLLLKNQNDNNAYLAVLNSKFMDWFFRITSTNNHIQGYELEKFPIPVISNSHQKKLNALTDHILSEKSADPSADTSKQEAEIDRRVYDLYGLTDEEIKVVESQY